MEDSTGMMVLAGAYLLGAVPFGLLVARLAGVGDIRRQGSGNIGATNVLRTAGKTAGAMALLLDMAKGALPVVIAILLAGPQSPWVAATALAVFLGHLFPVYLKFRGGKGVATGFGVWLAWMPGVGVALLAIWLLTAKLSRFSSLSALVAFAALPVILLGLEGGHPLVVAGVMTLLIFWKHTENIRRMIAGTESRIGRKD